MTNSVFHNIKWLATAERSEAEQRIINHDENDVYQLWAALKILITTLANATGTKVPDFCTRNSYKSSSGGASGPATSAKEKYISDILNYSPTVNFLEHRHTR